MFSTDVLSYHFALKPAISLPKDIEWLMPYDDPETKRCMSSFYQKFYNDNKKRTFILGINPGRFGAGVTGVPFTDPLRLNQLGSLWRTGSFLQEILYHVIKPVRFCQRWKKL